MKHILITGGAGYIGSHVVKLMGERNSKIVVLDNLSTGDRKSVLFGDLVVGDVGNDADLDEIFNNYDIEAVLHFAGSIVVPESVENPLKYYKNNTTNTLKLIQKCIEKKVSKFIFSSTAAVYGMGDDGKKITEDTSLRPINPYGTSKLMIEQILEDVSNAHKEFNYIALRYFNVAGADKDNKIGQSTPAATHLIKIAMQVAINDRPEMHIFGDDYDTFDGTCVRDYIHVMDLAQAHLDALTWLNENSGKSLKLNCGYGNGYSVKQVIDVVKKVVGYNFPVKISNRRDGDPSVLIANSDKIKKILGWKPKYNDLSFIAKTAYDWEKKLKERRSK